MVVGVSCFNLIRDSKLKLRKHVPECMNGTSNEEKWKNSFWKICKGLHKWIGVMS